MRNMRLINFLIFPSFLFFSLFFIKFQALASPQYLYKDTQLLINFKASLPNPSVLQTWLPNQNPCLTFSGVTCNNSTDITSIDLSNTLLSTTFLSVSSSLLSLEFLVSLSLRSTNLSGTISFDGKKCGAMLSTLDLSGNSLLGPLSDVISNLMGSCPSLKSLNFSRNQLSFSGHEITGGAIHTMSGLQVMDASFNYISGSNVVPWILSSGCDNMTYLSLKGNKIMGDADVSSCKRLKYLDLSCNNFSGEIPVFKDCLELEHIDLSSNKFYGDVGEAISGCSSLRFLNLSVNSFSGVIPSLPSKSLQIVSLSRNGFLGGIPSSFARDACENLVELDLSSNNLSGTVPSSFGSCSVLEYLDLSNNSVSGELPVEVLAKMSNLKRLSLGFNSFTGELPDSFLSELVGLEKLDLSSNGLSGLIPGGICINPENSLRELYLQNNRFTGFIPPSLSDCSKLVSLDLSFNYLKGKIPSSIGGLSNLRALILLLNELEGEIPQELMYIPTLENLILDFNKLTGNIPYGLSNCTKLSWMSLSNNRLSGEIPGWIGQLSNLAILKLSNNSFYGNIPPELGECRSLIWLDLNSNFLNGSIPPELFQQSGKIAVKYITDRKFAYIKNDGSKGCHGAGNLLEFAGIRPEQLNRISTRNPCNFTRVYKGIIQPTFTQNGSMIFLDISHNKLSGGIPGEIGTMHYLFVLNLGHNDISGTIPSEIGNLGNLNILDLSSNRLEGQIPPTMSGCSMLAEINLSNNLLLGPIPGGQLATLSSAGFSNNTALCGLPLTSGCGMETPPGLNSEPRKLHRGQASLVRSVAMVLLFSMFCIFGLILLAIEARKRRKMKDSPFGASTESRSPSVTATISWRLMDLTFEKPLKKLTYADLLEATNNFHHDSHIGSGGFGDVYRAQLRDGSVVAIKKLIHISGQGDREFTAEMETIGKIKHRNLVPLLGYCKVGEERLLVYEYMKYGSLEDVLHNKRKAGIKLNWAARKRIAIGAARGLAFLHHNCIPHIIHRDMKSSNVLLDDNLEARVSDFGMARLVSAMDTHLSVSTLAGTPGYVPPEYYQSFRCSTKGDVYSYGVVLLELLTGKRSTDSSDFGDNNLVGWVKQHEKLKISHAFDPELLKEGQNVEMDLLQHLKIASACLDDRPSRRPNMIQVLAMFKEIQAGSGHDSASTMAMSRTTSSGRIGAIEVVDSSIVEGVELSKQPGTV